MTQDRRSPQGDEPADARSDPRLAQLAHQIRNCLVPFRNGLHILKSTGDASEAAQQARQMMERQLAEMVRLVDDLLDATRRTGKSQTAANDPAVDDAAPSDRCRVLIAEDDVAIADSMSTMLRMMGHEVQAVADGEQALDTAARWRPDVILLDIGMPRLDGYDTARQIREHSWGKHIALIALTGWGHADDRKKALTAGFDQHFAKPVDPKDLAQYLAAIARRSNTSARSDESDPSA
jgi:CheY-like chemotaxis protein